jgi:poly(hydroxyalkanoate) granule-associated protein
MAAKKGKAKQRDSEKMVEEIREQLEDAFLAGLGAFANAQEAGEKRFDKLVKEGEKFRKKTTKKTEALIDDVQKAIREMTDEAQSKATGLLDQVRGKSRLDKLNEVFDKRVAGAMDRLQMSTKKDIDAINRKLDKIMKLLEARQPVAAKKTTPTPKPTTASKKKAPVKKTAVKQAA